MQTALVTADLGPVSLLAPAQPPRHVRATHGRLWQWIGEGTELISLSVAVRETRLGTPTGVRHHLTWEVDQVRSGMDAEPDEPRVADVLIQVEGAVGGAAADVAGRTNGMEVHDRLIVTTEGRHMHVVRILVPDNDAGRELSETVTSSLRVGAWSMAQ